MKLSELPLNNEITVSKDKYEALINAAIALNLKVPLNISNDLNKLVNNLELAIKNSGFNPRKPK